MGIIKKNTQYIPCQHKGFGLRGVHPDWEMHPSWIAGVEALDAYNHWVSEVVLPIAFQWIEEHKDEVYADVPSLLKDDVGVVIAAAFERVKELSAYKNGMARAAEYEAALANGSWDSTTINPVWSWITQKVRGATAAAFSAESGSLKDTVR